MSIVDDLDSDFQEELRPLRERLTAAGLDVRDVARVPSLGEPMIRVLVRRRIGGSVHLASLTLAPGVVADPTFYDLIVKRFLEFTG